MVHPPTCVGKTKSFDILKAEITVHPHVRGENLTSHGGYLDGNGTPPRAWGKHSSSGKSGRAVRYTPTCVGKTSPCQAPPA